MAGSPSLEVVPTLNRYIRGSLGKGEVSGEDISLPIPLVFSLLHTGLFSTATLATPLYLQSGAFVEYVADIGERGPTLTGQVAYSFQTVCMPDGTL